MMRFNDATRLASTKLRTRKVRLIITIIVAGMMFSVLAAVSFTARGIFASIDSFNQEGFGDRYIISASAHSSIKDLRTNPEVIARAQALYKEEQAQKAAYAKTIGWQYDTKNVPSITTEINTPDGGKLKTVDTHNPAARQAIKDYYKAHPLSGLPELKKMAASYGPVNYYESRSIFQNFGGDDTDNPTLHVIQNGKETDDDKNAGQNNPLASFGNTWSLISTDLLKPFLLPNADTSVGKDGSLPLIAPFNALEQMLGLKALSSTATPAERLEHIRQVRAGAASVTLRVCYRNQASANLLSQASNQQQEIAQNKNDNTYTKPPIVYGTPTQPCQVPPIASDSRSAFEKQNDTKRQQFEQAFGQAAPAQQVLTFRIVGVAPSQPNYGGFISGIVSSILSSNLGYGGANWFTPIENTTKAPVLGTIFATDSQPQATTHFVELSSARQAEAFLKKYVCEGDFSDEPGMRSNNFDPYRHCSQQGKYFALDAFGSNSLALESVKKGFSRIFGYVALGVAIVAGIIMIGTVGRTIADSRRETAVFRAIGAKKLDIAQIYLIYTIFLSLFIFVFALLAGFFVSQIVDHKFSDQITTQALVAYNAQNLNRVFHFSSFYIPDMLRLLGLSIAGGFLSAFFPLLRNLRRNPIRDMRDDT